MRLWSIAAFAICRDYCNEFKSRSNQRYERLFLNLSIKAYLLRAFAYERLTNISR